MAEPPPPPEPPRSTDARPIREKRRWALTGELGWNGLAGLGVNVTHHPISALAIDTGLGLSFVGWKVGVRVRANFLEGGWTPVAGAGFLYGGGSGGREVEQPAQGNRGAATVVVRGSPYLQFVGGASYTGDGGFVFLGTIGYALLLRDNVRYVRGDVETYEATKASTGSGLVLSVSFGYAF